MPNDTPPGSGPVSAAGRDGIVGRVSAPLDHPRRGGPARPADLDPAAARWLAWHEARAHGLVRREVRELGDAVLLHDPLDREPFWNRLAGVAWPSAAAAFDRRLAEALALFASLDRIPHIWPSPGFDEPPDLVARLEGHGFEDVGGGLLMVLDPERLPAQPAAPVHAGLTLERFSGLSGEPAAEAAAGIAAVLAESFTVEPWRLEDIERETIEGLGHEEYHACLVRIDGEPAAVARRTTFAGGSYLSSIGTRPRFRGRGLGRLVTDVVTRDSLAAGSRWTYLGVFTDNDVARRLYEGLGFVGIGPPAPDLLLRS